MMAQSRAESTWDIYNYGKCINQFPPNTIKAIRQYEWIKRKICRQKMSIMFNEIYICTQMHKSHSKSSKTHPERRPIAEHFLLWQHTNKLESEPMSPRPLVNTLTTMQMSKPRKKKKKKKKSTHLKLYKANKCLYMVY